VTESTPPVAEHVRDDTTERQKTARPATRTPKVAQPTFVIDVPDVTASLPFDSLFDPARPLEVDVGCGFGRFLLARAAAHPERQFLGIDRQLGRIRKIDRKLARAGLTHVRLLRLEAFYSLQFLLPLHRVRTFHVYFPDPWPKRRHHRRRLFSEAFLDVLWSRLEPGGTVEVATDHLDYFADIRKRLAADARFREVPHMPRGEAEQTDFELIFRRQGLPVGECAFMALPTPSTPSAPR
jgi:tRNA (guanine-N7-)-methyltransferase